MSSVESIPSPDELRIIYLSDMVPNVVEPSWMQLSIIDRSTGDITTVEESSISQDSMAEWDTDEVDGRSPENAAGCEAFRFPRHHPSPWSPDGRFLLMIRVSNLAPGQNHERIQYSFLDTIDGEWVNFSNGATMASADSFAGWAENERHTMLLYDDWGQLVEALPEISSLR